MEESQPKAGLERDEMSEPRLVKSMARPFSCIEAPGLAVGGEHDDAGIS